MKKKPFFIKLLRVIYWIIFAFCAFSGVGTLLYFIPLLSDVASNIFLPAYLYILCASVLLLFLAIFFFGRDKSRRNIIHLIACVLIVANFAGMSIWIVYNVNQQGEHISFAKIFTVNDFSNVREEVASYQDKSGKEPALSVFYMNDTDNKKPVIFYTHGGGWVTGTRYDRLDTTKTLVQNGFVVVCPEYDLCDEQTHLYATCEKQLLEAVKWCEKNVSKFGGDMRRFCMVGDSAGGNLALELAYKINGGVYQGYARVKAVSVIYPVTSIRAFYENDNLLTSATGKKMALSYMGATPQEEPKRYESLNPQKYIGKNTPPTLIVTGKMDSSVPNDATYEFAKDLVDAKVQTQVIEVPFANHVGDRQATNFMGQTYINNTVAWFKQ
ncbi:MAG: alpha/beta hydrolase [Clostridia bacterium]|nr:alpha/beta hydrolase [Clostridia bacterium]